MATRNDNII